MQTTYFRTVLCCAAVAWIGAACSFESDFSDTQYRCAQTQSCPDGYQCMAGFCEPDYSDPTARCGSMAMVYDDFGDDAVDSLVWNISDSTGANATLAEGQLALNHNLAMNEASRWVDVRTYEEYWFESSRAFIETVDISEVSGVQAELKVTTVNGNQVNIMHKDGILNFRTEIDGAPMQSVIGTISHVPEQTRWWQIREDNGQVFWETSPDGVNWEAHTSISSAPFVGPATPGFETYVPKSTSTVITMLVDNFNGGVRNEEWWCPGATFTDDFDEVATAIAWEPFSDGCTAIQTDGQLKFDFAVAEPSMVFGTTPPPHECGYRTYSYVDMTENTVAIEVPEVPPTGVELHFRLENPYGYAAEFEFEDGVIELDKVFDGEDQPNALELTYDPAQHRWWRFRTSDGKVFWETSPDGVAWEEHIQHLSPLIQLDQAQIVLRAEASSESGLTDVYGGFDNLNLTP